MTLIRSSFRISPLIQVTLISLYVALTIPLPFLAKVTDAPVSPLILWAGIILGLLLLIGALSERVVVDETQIKVTYPVWFPSFFRQGWSLNWQEIKDLKLRTTGQGGLVYYFISETSDKAYLLPMRVAGFSSLVKIVTEKTGIDTTDIRPLSQPWMYLILLVVTLFLLLMDSWTIWTAMTYQG
ncbi:hypothetical protein VB715_15375 [Crocosphaera sp. UHCC 0190]|uniref:hypothetical protein n=1 Tax=Crocosphaera sp. UHCC 0190 TaxID=3110246 RepID=UPI002B1EBEE0|nr:hypothetical protein [Crocosphaera sp. UHCC 0190]MEA5511154.1 hypothetical protein [Crocosphaera sp. UHCC 0190]